MLERMASQFGLRDHPWPHQTSGTTAHGLSAAACCHFQQARCGC
jgi:hypothetical protein